MPMNIITSMAKRPCERPADEHDPSNQWSGLKAVGIRPLSVGQ